MTDLYSRYQDLKASTKHLRARDAAAQLGVSEAELVAATPGATRLDTDAAALLHALPGVGSCMALTRCESAVSEVHGRYGGIDLGPHAGQVVGEGIDLRVFLDHWKHAFAIADEKRSIQIFDRSGTAVHKIFLGLDGDLAAWKALVAARAKELPLLLEPAPPPRTERPDSAVEVEALTAAWDGMTDTHEFFHLLMKHQVSRTQAFRLAGTSRARRVANDSFHLLLGQSSELHDKIMIFVGNRGCLQVFSGAVDRIVRTGPWLNVLDPMFNLHVREDHIASSWVVAKPTKAGIVSSLEMFDAAGDTIALVFRKRDDRDLAEDPAWRARLDGLPS